MIKNLGKEELGTTHRYLEKHQETDELRRVISEKTDEILNKHITLQNLSTIIRKDGVGQGGL